MPTTHRVAGPRRKPIYHVRNWAAYDRALVQRGSLTIWVSDEVVHGWHYAGPAQRGAQFTYSDQAIEAMLTVREVFHLTNRAAEGCLRSVFELLNVDLAVPDHSTLSRRGQTVAVRLPKRTRGPLQLVLDSSGLKVYGEGEWKVRQHGWSKRRTWRKVHLAVDAASGEVQAAMLSTNAVADGELVAPLLAQVDQPIARVAGDGSYDQRQVYRALATQAPGARVLIPPRANAHIWQHANRHAAPHPRDAILRALRQHGRTAWKRQSGYHQRSLVETAIFRVKRLFGDHLSARRLDTQASQLAVRCRALNVMTHLGMPDSYRVS